MSDDDIVSQPGQSQAISPDGKQQKKHHCHLHDASKHWHDVEIQYFLSK